MYYLNILAGPFGTDASIMERVWIWNAYGYGKSMDVESVWIWKAYGYRKSMERTEQLVGRRFEL